MNASFFLDRHGAVAREDGADALTPLLATDELSNTEPLAPGFASHTAQSTRGRER